MAHLGLVLHKMGEAVAYREEREEEHSDGFFLGHISYTLDTAVH